MAYMSGIVYHSSICPHCKKTFKATHLESLCDECKPVSTSYKCHAHLSLISSLCLAVAPKTAVELGVQQGASARAIAISLPEDGHFWGCDLFEDKYREPPHAETKASFEKAKKALNNDPLIRCTCVLFKDTAEEFTKRFTGRTDIIHVDICNHRDNLEPFLYRWFELTDKLMLIEGGLPNHWQTQYGFQMFTPLVDELCKKYKWNWIVIPLTNGHSLTVVTPHHLEKVYAR